MHVTVDMAAKGLGDVGSVSVPPELWDMWADPHFLYTGSAAPSSCPKVHALLETLSKQGLVGTSSDEPNARVCVKYKSPKKNAHSL